MRYTCDDIKKILASDLKTAVDQNAFLGHIETCLKCKGLGEIDRDLESALKASKLDVAPGSVSLNVMKSIRLDANLPTRDILKIITQLVMPAIGFLIIAAVTMFNFYSIRDGIVSTIAELTEIWANLSDINIEWKVVVSQADKLTLTPLLMAGMLGCSLLIWMLCIIRFKESIR